MEIDILDSHKLIATMMIPHSPKQTPNIVTYRKYNNFDKGKFIDEMSLNLQNSNLQKLTLRAFLSMLKIIFEKYSPLKKKYVRANQSRFFTKELCKIIMSRSKLRKRFSKDGTEEATCKCKVTIQ